MQIIARDSSLWNYMTPEIRDLIEDGEIILSFVYASKGTTGSGISDYSFIVFPFAKAYEGFLKRFFLDSGLITEGEYFSDEIRVGRLLNPNYQDNSSIYRKVCGGKSVPEKLWKAWKRGRNLVFHYFPHNYKRLGYNEALDIINELIGAMNEVVLSCLAEIKTSKKH